MNCAAGAQTLILVAVLLSPKGLAGSELSWSEGVGFRVAEVKPDSIRRTGFTQMNPAQTGVTFTNRLQGDQYLTNAVAHNGSGLAIGDVDGDGWQDIYFCNLEGPNSLYRNVGNWQFQAMDCGAAACDTQFSTGAAFADADGDGDLDLFVNGIAAGTRLFLNDGKGGWTESTGFSRTTSPTSIALADIDGDGDLDVYCTQYIDVMHLADPTTRFSLARKDGQWTVSRVNGQSTRSPRWAGRFEALPDGRVRELPEPDALYRNDGGGRFTPVQTEPGVFLNESGQPMSPPRDWGLAVMFRDVNGDGAPDLYVCNDNASPDRFWINTGRGAFRLIDPMALRHTSRSSMGIDFADVDRDGIDDFIVLDMLAREHAKRMTQLVKDLPDIQTHENPDAQPRYNRNVLFLGRQNGSFVETALLAGVAATDWSWCPIFLDVDLDGYEDLLVSNGFSFDVMDQDSHDQLRHRRLPAEEARRSRRFHPHWPTKNAAFRNRGDGIFDRMDAQWGFDEMGISYGMALGDLDNDGDLDVVANNLNAPAGLFRNEVASPRVAVRLRGLPPNRQGIGARIRLVNGSFVQSQEMIAGGRYMSGDQALRVFAARPAGDQWLEIKWRSGQTSVLKNVEANRIYEVDEPRDGREAGGMYAPAPAEPFFEEVSSTVAHRHFDRPFDDFAVQSSLPKRLSRLGPGVAWHDINDDGWEDLLVPAGTGGEPISLLNDAGKFDTSPAAVEAATSSQPAFDGGAVVPWADGKGKRYVLVARSGFETRQPAEIAAFADGNWSLPKRRWALRNIVPGPLAVADIDNDGDLDCFVGGRYLPGRYPEPAPSFIWINDEGELRESASHSKVFESAGIVSGAAFADLDNDGDADLILAVDWGPVQLFRNGGGQFERWDPAVVLRLDGNGRERPVASQATLAARTGWWTGIATGDFDADGRLDIAAANWGRNSAYELYRPSLWLDAPTQPVRPDSPIGFPASAVIALFYGDWAPPAGTFELLEAWLHDGTWMPVQDRVAAGRSLADVHVRFPTHAAYGEASISGILGSKFASAKRLEAVHFESTVFLNRGDSFQCIPLPREAQLAPGFSLNVADADGDGIEDLLMTQNFFGTTSQLSRDDAGTGLWLRGNGDGTFVAIDGSITGIHVTGEQRGAALADFNHDGKVDLAIAQNNGPVRLFANRGAKRGVRVTLSGRRENPDAIGAQMRILYEENRKGPMRTVQAGAGYWSHDSVTKVFGLAERAIGVWVRWPNGEIEVLPVSDTEADVRASHP